MRSFKKHADAQSVSIGTNPARFYLNEELIAQIPSETKPLLLAKEGLPTLPGKTTTLTGNRNNNEVRLQSDPLAFEPHVGDLRSRVMMTDFYNEDPQRVLSVVAKQAAYITGDAHRTLVPWDSKLTALEDDSRLTVNWLEEGPTSFNDMIADNEQDSTVKVRAIIVKFRIWSFVCITLGVSLLCLPTARTWLHARTWVHWLPGTRDICVLSAIVLALSSGLALTLAALPWFYFLPSCGWLLLVGGALSFGCATSMMWYLGLLPERPPPPSSHMPQKSYGSVNDASDASETAKNDAASNSEAVLEVSIEEGTASRRAEPAAPEAAGVSEGDLALSEPDEF